MDELEFFVNQLKEDDFATKLRAIQVLGEFGDPRALKPLLELYSHKDWQIRNAAIEAVCKIKSPEAIPILTEYLRDEDPNVRNSAMQTLEKLGEDVVPPLLEALKDDDEDVRIFACNTLGNLGEERAVEGLIEALDDENENVFYASAEALGRIKSPKAVLPLLKKLKEKDIWERFVIITSLGEIGDELAIHDLIKQLEFDELKQVTLEALGKIGFEEALPYIIKEVNTSTDNDIKLEGLKAIFNIAQNTYNFGRLERNRFLQDYTLENLKKIDFSHLEETFKEIFEGSDIELQYKILQIIQWAGNTLPIEILIKLIPVEELEDLANELLIKHAYDNPEKLIKIFNEINDTHIRYHIAKVLGYSTEEKVNEFLNSLLENEHNEIIVGASEALILSFSEIKAKEEFVNKLLSMLESSNDEIREASERVLIVLANYKEILNKLVNILENENSKALPSVIKIIAISNNTDYLPKILSYIEHPNPLVRKEVYSAIDYLAKIELNRRIIIESEFYDKILLGVYDTDEAVQIEAIYALGSIQEDRAFEALKNILFDEALKKLKPYIVRAIRNYYEKDLKDTFLEILQDELTDIETKLIIVQALRVIGDETIIEPLSDILFETDEIDLKSEIILTMGEIGKEEVLEYLFPFLEEDNWLIKNSVILALKNIISDEIKDEILKVFKEVKGEAENIIKNNCIQVLKNYPYEEVLSNLIPNLANPELAYSTYDAIFQILQSNNYLFEVVEKFIKESENIVIKRLLLSILKELKLKNEVKFLKELYFNTPYTSIKMMILKYFHAIKEDYMEICNKEKNNFLKTLCNWFNSNSIVLE